MSFEHQDVVGAIGITVDLIGVLVIVAGIVVAAARFARPGPAAPEGELSRSRFEVFRQDLARAILIGLEFLIAGDIIRTVAVTPTLESLALLDLIVLIRTFLSVTLHLEVEGRWPWQKSTPEQSAKSA